jgi:hypothetical protein
LTVLITLHQAKAQARVEHDEHDSDMLLKASSASAIVLNYLKYPDLDWTDRSVPDDVRAAVLLVFQHLYERAEGDPLSEGVKSLLHRHRDPTLA